MITSVSRPFCGHLQPGPAQCRRHVLHLLFAGTRIDLRGSLRDGVDDDALRELIVSTWRGRDDRYSERRAMQQMTVPRIGMSYIGG